MELILSLPEKASLREIVGYHHCILRSFDSAIPKLEVISAAEEFVFYWTECDPNSWVLDFKMLNSEHPRNRCVPTKECSHILLIQFQIFNKIRKDIDIRYEIKKVEKTSDKVFLLIQVCYLFFSIRYQIFIVFSSRS